MQKKQTPLTDARMLEELLRDRLVLYVRSLRVPPTKGLELVLRVMEEALNQFPKGSGSCFFDDFLSSAMDSLKKRIAESGLGIALRQEEGRHFSSVPSYNRGSMPPAQIKNRVGGA